MDTTLESGDEVMNGVLLGHLAGRHGKHRVHGWIVSAVVHMCGVGAALSLMTNLQLTPQPEPFRWEVSLQEPDVPTAQEQPEPTPAPPAPKKMEPKQIERTPVAPRPTESVEHVVREAEPIERQAQVQASPLAESRTAPSPMATPTVVASSEDVVTQHVQAVAAPQSAPSTIEHRVVQQRLVQYRQTQADYGWLRNALWSRIEELKRYSPQARMNHWEGKVVVEAVIRADGTVVNLKVAESSGREALDQHALLMVKTASPLTLKHPLGQTQVPILIPISYRLDG